MYGKYIGQVVTLREYTDSGTEFVVTGKLRDNGFELLAHYDNSVPRRSMSVDGPGSSVQFCPDDYDVYGSNNLSMSKAEISPSSQREHWHPEA